MKKLIVAVFVAALGWNGFNAYQRSSLAAQPADAAPVEAVSLDAGSGEPASFSCDGRTHCSQMTSCDEATYFINNCPGTKMDGDGDGIPCESQWCGP